MGLLEKTELDEDASKAPAAAAVKIERDPPNTQENATRIVKNSLGQFVEVRDAGTQMMGNHAGVQAVVAPLRGMRGTESALDERSLTRQSHPRH
eukprot:12928619-Prorocentrum_lima.AAC.1